MLIRQCGHLVTVHFWNLDKLELGLEFDVCKNPNIFSNISLENVLVCCYRPSITELFLEL